jgi:hypothetical protein
VTSDHLGTRGPDGEIYYSGTWHRFDGQRCKGSYTDGEN